MSRAWPVRGLDPNAALAVNARRIIAVRTAELFSFGPIVGEDSTAEDLHDLRIAAKRLRYSLELFRIVFGDDGERQIERVKSIQESLGQIHDHDVRITLIEEELAVLAAEHMALIGQSLAVAPETNHRAIMTAALRPPPDDPRRGLLSLLGRQHTSRQRHVLSFVDLWRRCIEDGLRQELVALSSLPIPAESVRQ